MNVSDDVRRYLAQIVERLKSVLGVRLVAVYAMGSLAMGGYRPGASDIDIYVVADAALGRAEKLAIALACSHRALPCPAKRLELVVLSAAAAGTASSAVEWELNLNTGAGQADHVGLDPATEPRHWFVIDLAIGYRFAVPLLGPPAISVFNLPSPAAIESAQLQAIVWYADHGMPDEAAAAACRAWHWRETGEFVSKHEAVRWAQARLEATATPQ